MFFIAGDYRPVAGSDLDFLHAGQLQLGRQNIEI
jgi:hypothetical protein